ncbi:MAG TPA: ATP-binding protein [Polyangiaceae bacterium]|nr:ATP-binding protein [Polyangiaceae bacterium]
MSELDPVIQTLERYISPLNARSLVHRAMRDRPTSNVRSPKALAELVTALQKSIRLFLAEPELSRASRELAKLCQSKAATRVGPCQLTISTESDIITARMEARRICDEMNVKSFETQKVTTVVSELARNIISYTSGGRMEIAPIDTTRRIAISAVDEGPGIPHLANVLSGNYQSRTGLGRGLMGTKRLAVVFDVTTGPGGTRIVAEIAV